MAEQLEKSASEINYLEKALSDKTGMINDFVNNFTNQQNISRKQQENQHSETHSSGNYSHNPDREDQKTDKRKIDNIENTENIDRPVKSLVIGDSILKGVKKISLIQT